MLNSNQNSDIPGNNQENSLQQVKESLQDIKKDTILIKASIIIRPAKWFLHSSCV